MEILLGNKSFCNLVEIDLSKFTEDPDGLAKALHLMSRANYRQTCVNLDDGILQRTWHENNEYLHLCGVGLTGIASVNLSAYDYKIIKNLAVLGAYSMADELELPRPKNVTTIKPSGTLSKIMDSTEGIHKPLGKYIFNNVVYSKHDPIVKKLKDSNYYTFNHPFDGESVLVRFPVCYENVSFDKKQVLRDNKFVEVEVNNESAIEQLEKYKLLMDNYVEQNCSATISYSADEKEQIVDWLMDNWDSYVGVSFLFRNDPTKTAKDLGYQYLPQEVVTKEEYESYFRTLLEFDLDNKGQMVDELDADCVSGACPIR